MRDLLSHQITVEDLILAVSLFFNLIGALAVLVAVDIRFENWRRRRAWKKRQADSRENIRNPVYGMKPKEN